MLAEKYGSQTYFYIYDWEEFDAKRRAYSKKGYLLTSICSNKSGFAAIMSKVPSWSHESTTTRWASSTGTKELEQNGSNPITSLFFKDGMLTIYRHAGPGLHDQDTVVSKIGLISMTRIMKEVMDTDYVITDTAFWNSTRYIVCSKGLKWKQRSLFVEIKDGSGYIGFDHEPGSIITECFPLSENTAIMIFSTGTVYSDQLLIANPTVEQLKVEMENGYSMSMVRGVGDNIYVFLVK